ncbi:unnamed protein product [Eretmochelys imbricata]
MSRSSHSLPQSMSDYPPPEPKPLTWYLNPSHPQRKLPPNTLGQERETPRDEGTLGIQLGRA